MASKKLAENERCHGILPSGVGCPRAARYGDPPQWCPNCDPSPEADARRRQAGRKRHPRGTPEVLARQAARAEGTLDQVVRRCLDLAKTLESAATKAAKSPGEDGKNLQRAAALGFASSRLHAQAVLALKARAMVGDITPRPDAPKSAGAAPQAREDGALESWLPGRADA